jgi:NDP-sugar pyrophosphorylase family protein
MTQKIKDYESEAARTQVVMPVGGSGKRMGMNIPKALVKLGDDELIDRCANLFMNCGFRDFVLLLSHDDKQISEHVAASKWREGARVTMLRDYAPGIAKGKAIRSALAEGKIDRARRCMLAFPDDVFLDSSFPMKVLLEHLYAVKAFKTFSSVVVAKAHRYAYGVAQADSKGIVTKFEEKPLVPLLTSTGVGILEPEAYGYIDRLIDLKKEGPIELEDAVYPKLAEDGKIYAITIPPDAWISVNTTKELEQAQKLVDAGVLPKK